MKVTFKEVADFITKSILKDIPEVNAHNAALMGKDLARAAFRFWSETPEVTNETYPLDMLVEALNDLGRNVNHVLNHYEDLAEAEERAQA